MPAGTVSIVFTDEVGTVTLTNGKPYPASRFTKWEPTQPFTDKNAASATRLGSGQRDAFVFRTDYGAKFQLQSIPATKHGDCVRLLRWLQGGGFIAVNTGDVNGASYPTCGIAEGTTPALTFAPDGAVIQYALQLEVLNLADTPVAMVCQYGTYD
jgi:hypothetical protein